MYKTIKILSLYLLVCIHAVSQSQRSVYSASSDFPSNPRAYDEEFLFDYNMVLKLNIEDRGYRSTIYFNSADGTIGITDYSLIEAGGNLDVFDIEEFHHGILFPDGKIMLYGLARDADDNLYRACNIINNTAIRGEQIATAGSAGYTPSMREVEGNQYFQAKLREASSSRSRAHPVFGPVMKYSIEVDEGGYMAYDIADKPTELIFSPEIIAITPFGIPLFYKDHSTQTNRIVTKTQMDYNGGTYIIEIQNFYSEGRGISLNGSGYQEQHLMQFDASDGEFSSEYQSLLREYQELMQNEDLSKEEVERLIKQRANEKLRRD